MCGASPLADIYSPYTSSLKCWTWWHGHRWMNYSCFEYENQNKMVRPNNTGLPLIVRVLFWKLKFYSDKYICRYIKTWKNLCLCVSRKLILQLRLLSMITNSTWTTMEVRSPSQNERNRCTENIFFWNWPSDVHLNLRQSRNGPWPPFVSFRRIPTTKLSLLKVGDYFEKDWLYKRRRTIHRRAKRAYELKPQRLWKNF